jgi:hypothetical protein
MAAAQCCAAQLRSRLTRQEVAYYEYCTHPPHTRTVPTRLTQVAMCAKAGKLHHHESLTFRYVCAVSSFVRKRINSHNTPEED